MQIQILLFALTSASLSVVSSAPVTGISPFYHSDLVTATEVQDLFAQVTAAEVQDPFAYESTQVTGGGNSGTLAWPVAVVDAEVVPIDAHAEYFTFPPAGETRYFHPS
jgi:hypothetical protein